MDKHCSRLQPSTHRQHSTRLGPSFGRHRERCNGEIRYPIAVNCKYSGLDKWSRPGASESSGQRTVAHVIRENSPPHLQSTAMRSTPCRRTQEKTGGPRYAKPTVCNVGNDLLTAFATSVPLILKFEKPAQGRRCEAAAHASFWRPNSIWAGWPEVVLNSGLVQKIAPPLADCSQLQIA